MADFARPVVERSGGFVVVVLAGEVDLAVKTDLIDAYNHAIAPVEIPHLLVDLTKVTFMDSTGLSTLLTAWTRVTAHGGIIAVVGASPRIQRLLEITQLDRVIPVLSGVPMRPVGTPHAQSSSTA